MLNDLNKFFNTIGLQVGLVRGLSLTERDIEKIKTEFDDSMDIKVDGDKIIELMVVDNKYVDIDKMTEVEYEGCGY